MTPHQTYAEYKSAGVPWLDHVPAEWPIVATRVALRLRKELAASPKAAQLLSLTKQGVIRRDIENAGGKHPENYDSYQMVYPDDLIFCLFDIDETPRTVGITRERGMISGAYTRFETTPAANPEFVTWYFIALDNEKRLRPLYTGLRKVIQKTRFLSAPMPIPPLKTQRTIATYLDRESAQIDDLIGKQERLIELLAEKRQAIITHAVTKGLNPNAPTKPSGVPWLGEVPQTWRTAELKRALTFITSGSRGWAEYYADHGKPFVRIGNLTRGHLHLDMAETQHVEIPPDAEGTRAVVEAGDVLFSITAYLGSVAVASKKESGSYVSQHVAITRLDQNRLHPRFLAYFILSEFGQRQLNEGAYGGTKLQLSLEDIKKLMIPVPGMSEQIEIARHLDTSAARIDALVGLSHKSISLLRERRSALISAAVTGKIDVREGVA